MCFHGRSEAAASFIGGPFGQPPCFSTNFLMSSTWARTSLAFLTPNWNGNLSSGVDLITIIGLPLYSDSDTSDMENLLFNQDPVIMPQNKSEYFSLHKTLRGMDSHLIRDMDMALRPRERLAKHGAPALQAEELLALVLRTGYRGHGAVDVARDILA